MNLVDLKKALVSQNYFNLHPSLYNSLMVQIMSSLSTSRKIYEQNFDFPEEGLFLWFINMSYDTLPPKIALDDISKPWNLPGVKIRQDCKLNSQENIALKLGRACNMMQHEFLIQLRQAYKNLCDKFNISYSNQNLYIMHDRSYQISSRMRIIIVYSKSDYKDPNPITDCPSIYYETIRNFEANHNRVYNLEKYKTKSRKILMEELSGHAAQNLSKHETKIMKSSLAKNQIEDSWFTEALKKISLEVVQNSSSRSRKSSLISASNYFTLNNLSNSSKESLLVGAPLGFKMKRIIT